MNTNPLTAQQNRHLYWLLNHLGVKDKDAIADIVSDFTHGRATSTSQLEFIEAQQLIRSLSNLRKRKQPTQSERIDTMVDDAPERAELDRKRKGVLRAIFRWGELQGLKYAMDYVKGIASNAAGVSNFNEISPVALTRIYHEFCKKQKTVTTKNELYIPCMN